MSSFKFAVFSPNGKIEYFLAAFSEKMNSYGAVYYKENGPAVIQADGTQEYYVNGRKSRVGEPAVVGLNGYQEFWTNGVLGRKEGPAIVYGDGGEDWIYDKVYHRKDGAARTFADGTKHYYYQGKRVHALSDKEFIRIVKLSSLL